MSAPAEARARTRTGSARRADVIAAAVAVGLFAVAAVVGGVLSLLGHPVNASAAPLFAHWLPHVGPGTPFAVLIAVLVCTRGPALADRLEWRRLLGLAYGTGVLWIFALALVDGWQRGIAGRLTTRPEYLSEVPGVTDVPAMIRGFSARILDFRPGSWTTHVAGHPPGAFLVFVGLDRLGLRGGGWAGVTCILVGALTVVAVPQTVRLLGRPDQARAVVPFAVLFPGAVWIGVSADGMFAGVAACGIALLARRRSALAAFGGGLLLGCACFLSYGLPLLAPIALAVVLLGGPGRRRAWWALPGVALVFAGFALAGFDWLTGYHLVSVRYYQGIAAHRPYAYWVWADLAILAVSAGPVVAPILRRTALAAWHTASISARSADSRLGGWRLPPDAVSWLLPLAAAVAIVAADLSGFSKAEVERIWLPFAVWFAAGAGLLPGGDRRAWLAGQAVVALAVNHLLLTTW